jgi:hypothetical protein
MSGVVAVMSSDRGDLERIRQAVERGTDVVSTIDAASTMAMFESDSVLVCSHDRVDQALQTFPVGESPPIIVLGDRPGT